MKYNPEKHRRRSIRLKEYDYSKPGQYFITICIQNREMLFGDVKEGEMLLNEAGEMIKTIWTEIPKYYPGITIDFYQIMPNHFHGIVNIAGTDPRVCPDIEQTISRQSQRIAPALSIPDVIQRLKSLTTKRYIDEVNQNNWQPFKNRLWQRNYYEHIIRDERDLNRIRQYIIENPLKWQNDKYYL